MKAISRLLKNNRDWARRVNESCPDFFSSLVKQQSPEYLWIGCSDSRVPANEIVGLKPGELFVHRNVANLVIHSDANCLSVLQYAVDHLKVKHIIVCGHYGCGGVTAAISGKRHGLVDNWLGHVRDIYYRKEKELRKIRSPEKRLNRLCELNVIEQVLNVARTTVVQDAWDAGRKVIVHGWIYDLRDGLLKDLDISIRSRKQLQRLDRMA